MIVGFLVAVLLWLLFYGLNVPIRWFLLRRHRAQQTVVLESWLKYPARKINSKRIVYYTIWIVLTIVSGRFHPLATDEGAVLRGLMFGAALCVFLWPLYVRSKTSTLTLLVFDRQGMSVYPVRRGWVGRGTFQTRLNWVDCYGYSYYKGHLLFALRSGGQIEQETGNRLVIGQTLQRLGIRKLRMYDILERDPQRPERNQQQQYEAEIAQLLEQVETLTQDIVDSYQADAAEMGLTLQAELRSSDDSEAQDEPYRFLHLSLRKENEEIDELDWMICAQANDFYEILHLPEERLYEAIDERVLTLIEAQQRERGQQTPQRVILQ